MYVMLSRRQSSVCGNAMFVGPHRVFDGGDGFNRYIKIDLPGIRTAALESFTCAHCGHVEWFVDNGGLSNIRNTVNYQPLSSKREVTCPSCGTAQDQFMNSVAIRTPF